MSIDCNGITYEFKVEKGNIWILVPYKIEEMKGLSRWIQITNN